MHLHDESIRYHEARAAMHLREGRPEYAKGSMRKAARWRQRKRALDLVLNGPLPEDPRDLSKVTLRRMSEHFATELENAFLHGTGRS